MDLLTNFFVKARDFLLSVLPTSPFRQFIDNFSSGISAEWLGWLNWFVPIGGLLAVMALWLGAIGTFYLYSIVMRWIKMIGD